MLRKFYKKLYFVILFIFINCSFTQGQNELKIIDKTVNFGMRPAENRTIDAIIVHSVYNASGGDKYDIDLVINQFAHYGVSSHYVIGREGNIYRLVKEKDVSFHAGKSSLPDGRTNVNSCSIGIELITTKDSLDAPMDLQIKTLTSLVKDIQSRYKINYVLRHSDIAPGRKTDPWNMNWQNFLKTIKDKKSE
jgi:N-acetyl-anhydromuramyl-L-alanine amidase AmpD